MQLVKKCTKCQVEKILEEFNKRSDGKYGRGSWCKVCKNRDRANYPRSRNYRKSNLEYYYRNKDKWRLLKARRRCAELNAIPAWLSELDLLYISELYIHAKDLSRMTGIVYEVDHIIPLQGAEVCGLHVPLNLQLLPRTENRSKANKLLTEYVNYEKD